MKMNNSVRRNFASEKMTYFFDTCAILKIKRGNPKYERYTDCNIITTIFNLAELNYNLKKDMDKERADSYIKDYENFLVDVDIKNVKIKNKHMPIPECIGYVVAKEHEVKILTEDDDFKNLDSVEFVKK